MIQTPLIAPQATIFLPKGLDQMPFAADGSDKSSPRRRSSRRDSSKRIRIVDSDEVQDTFGERHSSNRNPRRTGNAAAGQRVVQPEVIGSRSARKRVPSFVRVDI